MSLYIFVKFNQLCFILLSTGNILSAMTYANITDITSFTRNGADTIINVVANGFPDRNMNCRTPHKWHAISPESPSAMRKGAFLNFIDKEQSTANRINPNIKLMSKNHQYHFYVLLKRIVSFFVELHKARHPKPLETIHIEPI